MMLIYLDSNVVIYMVEQFAELTLRASGAVASLADQGHTFAVSHLVRMECRVGPLLRGDEGLLEEHEAFLARMVSETLDLPAQAFDRAAQIRAAYRIPALDALHLAAAVEGECGAFLTNDAALACFPDLDVILLPD
jgi:predicted nucleic acid-binding protein